MKLPIYLILYKTYHAQSKKISPYRTQIGLSQGQPKILNYLIVHNHCMQKDLALFCNIEPATVSKLLNNMEQDGLIERNEVPENRRARSICITEKGREKHKQWTLYCKSVEADALKGFSEEEKQKLRDLLEKMYYNLTGAQLL